jgi:hypothetical protein
MKKFSNITNQEVGKEPNKDTRINEQETLKMKLLNLMDNYLTIQTYGPIDRYLRAGTIKIMGKEIFAEALINIMGEKSLKEQTKLLESLKSGLRDWELIDERIEEVNVKIAESQEKSKMLIHRNKIISIYEKYGNDEEMLMTMTEKSCEKIKTAEKARIMSITAEYMSMEGKYPKATFEKISEKFSNRYKNLITK